MSMNRDMMAKMAQMQERLAKAQADLAEKRAEGSSGGGAVQIVVTGGMKVDSLKIDKEVVDILIVPDILQFVMLRAGLASLGGIRIYSWTFSAFLLTSTVSMPIWGRLADHLGRRPAYLGGLALFLLGSALAGFSRSMEQLIAFRALQGLGAGSLITIGMTIIGDLYGMERRAKMQGYFSSVWGMASLVGPLVGGLLTDRVSWRWVFYINLPVGLVAYLMTRANIFDPPYIRRGAGIDYWGIGLLAVGIAALQIGLDQGQREDWFASHFITVLMIVAVVGLGGFIAHALTTRHPVVDLRLFKEATYATGVGLIQGVCPKPSAPYSATPQHCT